jgi:hypothetical protein
MRRSKKVPWEMPAPALKRNRNWGTDLAFGGWHAKFQRCLCFQGEYRIDVGLVIDDKVVMDYVHTLALIKRDQALIT